MSSQDFETSGEVREYVIETQTGFLTGPRPMNIFAYGAGRDSRAGRRGAIWGSLIRALPADINPINPFMRKILAGSQLCARCVCCYGFDIAASVIGYMRLMLRGPYPVGLRWQLWRGSTLNSAVLIAFLSCMPVVPVYRNRLRKLITIALIL